MTPVKRTGFTAKQSRRTSRKMEASQIGTHYARRAAHASPNRRAAYARRKTRTSTAKRVAILVGIVALLAVIAVVVGSLVFLGTASSRLSLGSDDAAGALVSPAEGEPYYTLLAADLDDTDDAHGFSADAIVLARVDAASKALTLVSVPSNARVSMSDGNAHPLSEAVSVKGDAELISAVSTFADVDIAHYARTDAAGITAIVDRLGGVDVSIPEEVDDPRAGIVYIPAGDRTLSSSEALTFLRARNYTNGAETQGAYQCAFIASAAEDLLASSGPGVVAALDAVAGHVKCDLDANGVLSLTSPLSGVTAASVVTCRIPGYETVEGGEPYFTMSSSAWKDMLASIEGGADPSGSDDGTVAVDPASFEITVRNGGGVTGAGAKATDVLTAAGFNVVETGNTNTYAYDETLVVYADSANADRAQAVVNALGAGRAIASNGFYTFETEILVVIGRDWMPIV